MVCAFLMMGSVAKAQLRADVLIRGGRVVDGTGARERVADVAITGDRITFVGDAAGAGIDARRTIDAKGLIVAPGFIDPHTHTLEDLSSTDSSRRRNAPYLAQGVTTVLTGNDGGGPSDVGASLTKLAKAGIGSNAALYVGFGSVRTAVLGMSAAEATAEQASQMARMVRKSMQDGALGMSAGLYYAPQSYASTDEVIVAALEVAPFGGVYDTHLRDESSYSIGLLSAIAEAIRIGREARVAVNISHIKALGVDVWGKSDSAIALIRAARAAGQRVTADQYPYTASGSSVGASLLPRWAEAGGRDSLKQRLSDPATRAKIVAEMRENLRRRGGAESLLITERDARGLGGKRLSEIAATRKEGADAIGAAIDIIVSGDASVASFNMKDEDITRFMKEEFTMTGSDGSDGHPRKYGTFARKYRIYVKERQVLSLPEFVHRSSQLPAQTFGLKDRGVLARGAFADVIVFDEATFADRSTYEAPERLATGVRFALVNGELAIDRGEVTKALAGRPLRRDRD
ncbi:MAG: amidohydrolase family protein [Gemmatimonadaceae bacterium]